MNPSTDVASDQLSMLSQAAGYPDVVCRRCTLENGNPELETFEFEVPALYPGKSLAAATPEEVPSQIASVEIRGRGFIGHIPQRHIFQPGTRNRSYSINDIPGSDNYKTYNRRRASSTGDIGPQTVDYGGFPAGLHSWELKEALYQKFPHLFPRWRSSSPRYSRIRRSSRLDPAHRHLIGDVMVSKTRLVITKTHCLYPEVSSLIQFSSCLIGFHLVVHPCHSGSRVRHLKISLQLEGAEGKASFDRPDIMAIYPLEGKIHETGGRTPVITMRGNSIGVQLGASQYGTATVSHNKTTMHDSYTVPYVSTSGVHTSELIVTMKEDESLKAGVAPSLYFAALLKFESIYNSNPTITKAFKAILQVHTQSRETLPLKWWSSPKKWVLNYDGKTELGHLDLHT